MGVYDQLTSSLNDLFTEQLTESVQWRVVPGQLSRIVSSPSGYTWGVNASQDVFLRRGNDQWLKVEKPTSGTILDLTADSQYVYVLVQETGDAQLRRMSISGDGSWTTSGPVPSGTQTIVATSSQLVADTTRGAFVCSSPCTQPAWVSLESVQATLTGPTSAHELSGTQASSLTGSATNYLLGSIFPAKPKVTVTSASARYVYGVDGNGKAHVYKSGEWVPIQGLASKSVSSVSGETDDTAIYAIESSGRVWRCRGTCSSDSDLEAVGSAGNAPDTKTLKQFAVDPAHRELWQLSPVKGGSQGSGILMRPETLPDLLAKTGPLDAQRDLEVDQLQQEYANVRSNELAGRDIKDATTYLAKLKSRVPPDEDERILRRRIDLPAAFGPSLFLLQVAVGTILAVLLLYMALPAPFSHAIAFVVACIGLAISFSASKK